MFALRTVVVLLGLVGLSAYRYPDEKILERLYDLEMRGQPLFQDDPRYQLLQQEEEHPMVLDDILPYFPEDDEYEEPSDYYHSNNVQPRDGPDHSPFLETETSIRSNDPRDPERAQQSALWGTHYVSGGAGEGKQVLKPNGEEKNKQEVKTDNALPAYCEPPNPCPKGYTEKDNCVQGVDDTPSFNRKYILAQQASGYCACDSEHMKQCPNGKPKINTKPNKAESQLQNALEKQDMDDDEDDTDDDDKRRLWANRVAKKSPIIYKRFARSVHKRNPYMGGPKLRTAAKKSPPKMEYDRWNHYEKMRRRNWD